MNTAAPDHRPPPSTCKACKKPYFTAEIAYENGLYRREFYFNPDPGGRWSIIAWWIDNNPRHVLMGVRDPEEMCFTEHLCNFPHSMEKR